MLCVCVLEWCKRAWTKFMPANIASPSTPGHPATPSLGLTLLPRYQPCCCPQQLAHQLQTLMKAAPCTHTHLSCQFQPIDPSTHNKPVKPHHSPLMPPLRLPGKMRPSPRHSITPIFLITSCVVPLLAQSKLHSSLSMFGLFGFAVVSDFISN